VLKKYEVTFIYSISLYRKFSDSFFHVIVNYVSVNQILMFRMFRNLLTKLLLKNREVHYFELIQTNAIGIFYVSVVLRWH